MIDQILFMITDIYPSMAFIMIVGMVLFFLFYLLAGKLKPRSKMIGLVGIFLELSWKNEVRFSFSILKFLYVFSLLFQIEDLQLVQYVLLAEIIVINALLYLPKIFSLKCIGFDLATLLSMFVLSSLCSFKDSLNSDTAFYIILVTASVFIVLFEYYRFMDEINYIVKEKGAENAKVAD